MKTTQNPPVLDAENTQPVVITDAEWCFQFFGNEPIVFGWQEVGAEPTALTLKINPVEGDGLNFQQNGMVFKIFPRPISEETKQLRAQKTEGIADESKG